MLDVVNPRTMSNGNVKWTRVGIAFENEGKATRILLDALPCPDTKTGEIVLMLMKRKDDDYVSQKNE